MPDLVTAVALAVCWGTVIVVWCAGAAFNGIRARGAGGSGTVPGMGC